MPSSMKTHSRAAKVATTHTLQLAAILVTGFLLYEPLGTAIFLLGIGVGLLVYMLAGDEPANTEE